SSVSSSSMAAMTASTSAFLGDIAISHLLDSGSKFVDGDPGVEHRREGVELGLFGRVLRRLRTEGVEEVGGVPLALDGASGRGGEVQGLERLVDVLDGTALKGRSPQVLDDVAPAEVQVAGELDALPPTHLIVGGVLHGVGLQPAG